MVLHMEFVNLQTGAVKMEVPAKRVTVRMLRRMWNAASSQDVMTVVVTAI